MHDYEQNFISDVSLYLQSICSTHLKNKAVFDTDTVIQNIIYDFVNVLEEEYGGQYIYIRLNSPTKKKRIYNDFNGSNYNELAKKYKISSIQIRKIIKQIQKENQKNKPKQGSVME